MVKVIILLVVCSLGVGCSSVQKHEEKSSLASSNVKANAKFALEQCGRGNVEKVTSSGFSCKK